MEESLAEWIWERKEISASSGDCEGGKRPAAAEMGGQLHKKHVADINDNAVNKSSGCCEFHPGE